jgi:cell division protein FtsB
MNRLRWLGAALALGMVLFAIQGGTFSTWDWLTLRHDEAAERDAVDLLKASIDSLEKVAALVERDPAEQERIAREEFGMIREGEFLYRLVPDSSDK